MPELRDPIKRVIGNNFKRIRNAVGLTQDEAAQYVRRVGPLWSATRVADFEGGRSDVTVGLLAAVSLAMTAAIRDARQRGADVPVGALPADFLLSDGQVALTSMGPDPLGSALSAAFQGVDWPATDAELLGVEGAAMKLAHEYLTQTATGKVTADELAEVDTEHPVADIKRKAGLAERRVAERLGIALDELAELSCAVWGQTFTEARNEIAGVGASQQKRGRVARELELRLRREIDRGDH